MLENSLLASCMVLSYIVLATKYLLNPFSSFPAVSLNVLSPGEKYTTTYSLSGSVADLVLSS